MKESNLVSIIIPCFNDASFIEKSVSSAINQDYENIEVVVVDDGSDQNTKNVLRNIESKISKLITQKHNGVSAARNMGISVATGKYVLTLDSDDYFDETFCDKAVKLLEENVDAKIVSCYAKRFGQGKEDIIRHSDSSIRDFLKYNHTLGNALFYKKDWELAGGYDEDMKKGYEDWEFFIRLLKNGGRSMIIPEVLFFYRMKEKSNSTIADSHKYELLRYIYTKHSSLYKENFEILVDHLLCRLEVVEKAERKNLRKPEFRLGKTILDPIRKIKRLFKS
jgi:glycosyltransferase involved in cell wall biosynthesis